jgi:FKBP-type peptidyl-prolyl cis-trans isomerase
VTLLALWWGCAVEGPQPAVHPSPGAFARALARTPPQRPVVPEELWVAGEGGLRIADLQVGEGEEVPSPPALLVLEVTGWHLDSPEGAGTRWWSTYETPHPTRFSLGQAPLRAWDVGVVGMRVGGVRMLEVPAPLAFGEDGAATRVAPNTAVQLLLELEAIHHPRLEPAEMTAPQRVGEYELVDLVVGEGAEAVAGSRVTFDRTEWTADGTLLGTSFRDMVPPTVVLGSGQLRWESALVGMREGGERQVKIPRVPEGSSLLLSLVVHDVK